MTFDQDCFRRAAKRFVIELGAEGEEQEQAADDQVFENKEKVEAVVELEPAGLGEDMVEAVVELEPAGLGEDMVEAVVELEPEGLSGDVPEVVDLLEIDGSGGVKAEHVQEGSGPEKVITTIRVDGEEKQVEVYQYPNGALKDVATGKFLSPPSPNTFLDPEKARDAVTIRHARATEEARAGLIRGVVRKGHDGVEDPEEAWGIVVEEQAVVALSDKRGSTGAARFVGQVTGLAGEDKQRVDVKVAAVVVGAVDLDGILLGMFNRLHPGDPQRALSEMKTYKDKL